MSVPKSSQHKRSQPADCVASPWPNEQPSRIGVLSNPLSGSNQDGLGPIHQVVRRHPEVLSHREASCPEDVYAALEAFADDGIDLIAINGGDGTIQAVLTGLFGLRPFRTLPALALLYGGTSNMLPKDFGLRGPQHIVLSRLLRMKAANRPLPLVSRPVLKVDAAGQSPLYGMFFGAACIYKGIQFFHSKVHTLGLSGELAHGIVVARFLSALLSRRSELVAPQPISVELDDGDQLSDEYLVFLVSSLEKLILGLRPYWGSGPGPLHMTALRAEPKYFLKAIVEFFRGSSYRYLNPQNGYHSREVEAVRLRLQGGFTLDGELYQTGAPGHFVNITAGGNALFVCQNG